VVAGIARRSPSGYVVEWKKRAERCKVGFGSFLSLVPKIEFVIAGARLVGVNSIVDR
jgi:hypothetical protein